MYSVLKGCKRKNSLASLTRCCSVPFRNINCTENEFTSTPEYPPININKGTVETERLKEWHKKILRQPTVEEKLFEVNVPRRWGWKCFMIHEGIIPYNNLSFSQHATRTHLVKTEALPSYYENSADKCIDLAKKIRDDVVDSIEYQLHVRYVEIH